MAAEPGYEQLQQRIRELEADKLDQSTRYNALNNLFNLSLDMLCVADLDGYFRLVNSAFESTLGYSRQVLLNTPFIEFVHPDDKAATRDAFLLLASGEPLPYFENRYRCHDGSYKWLAWTCSELTEEALLYAVARDMTAQKSLQREQETQRDLFANILSNVPAAIFWKDRNSVYLGANERFARDTGLSGPQEVIGKTDYDLAWTREQSDFYRECDRTVMDNNEPMLEIEESQQQADGKEIHLLTNKVPLLDASGQVYGMLGIYMDITKRKQAESTLIKSESRLRTLFDSAAEFIFVIDPEGGIINANRNVYEQSGYKANEVIGSNIKDFFSDESKHTCDCNFPGLRERGYNRADIEFVCKDGHVIEMECSATGIPDEHGEFSSFLIIQHDVTERKRAAADLAISERRFRTIFNSSYQLIGILDPEGRLLDANQTALDLFALRREDVVGRYFRDTYWWQNSVTDKDQLKAAISDASLGKPVRYEQDALDAEGTIRTINFTLKPVVDEQGETLFIIAEGRDITEIKKAEEATQLHHQEIAHVTRLSTAGEMASGMAHELNQPLTALVSYCGTATALANTMPAPPAQLLEVLELATDQAHRAGLIIRNLREFVSKGGDQKKPLDLDQIILDVISLLKYELQTSGVTIDFSPGGHSHRVIAAKIQVEQVLINMVRNSLEAIENANTSGGHIILQSRILPNNSIEVTVSDNGPGVNPEILEDIFNPFQTSKKTGMGIGLSLSRSIIEMHGGKLWVDRNCQNGALFGFELPIST